MVIKNVAHTKDGLSIHIKIIQIKAWCQGLDEWTYEKEEPHESLDERKNMG